MQSSIRVLVILAFFLNMQPVALGTTFEELDRGRDSFGVPAINDFGRAAYRISRASGAYEIYAAGAFGPLSRLASTEGSAYRSFENPSLGNSYDIVLHATTTDWRGDILVGHGSDSSILGLRSIKFSHNSFHSEMDRAPTINKTGTVAFVAQHSSIEERVFVETRGILESLAFGNKHIDSSGSTQDFFYIGSYAIDSRGDSEAVFAGRRLIRTAPTAPPTSGPSGFYLAQSGTVRTVFEENASARIARSSWDISGRRLSFTGESEIFVLDIDSGVPKTIADTSGTFRRFFDTSINRHGDVAFTATLDDGSSGVYLARSGTIEPVIETGDALLGSTVVSVASGRDALNDFGALAVVVRLANGDSVIAITNPTAPGTSALNPVLPSEITSGVFRFFDPAPHLWYDPPLARGFSYELIGEGEFSKVMLPFGVDEVRLSVDGAVVKADLTGGETFFFAAGVKRFTIDGISPWVDAADPAAFPAMLDFSGMPTELRMVAIPVPEPSQGLLFLCGIAIVALGYRATRGTGRSARSAV